MAYRGDIKRVAESVLVPVASKADQRPKFPRVAVSALAQAGALAVDRRTALRR